MIRAHLNILTERCKAHVAIKEEDVRCVGVKHEDPPGFPPGMLHEHVHVGWLADGTNVTWQTEE